MEEKDTVERVKFDLTNTLKSRINDFNELANFQKKFIATDIDSNLYYNGRSTSNNSTNGYFIGKCDKICSRKIVI